MLSFTLEIIREASNGVSKSIIIRLEGIKGVRSERKMKKKERNKGRGKKRVRARDLQRWQR